MGFYCPELVDYYYTTTQEGMSAEQQDFASTLGGSIVSAEIQDVASLLGAVISAEYQDVLGLAVIVEGVNLATGFFQPLTPADRMVRSNGALLNGTGIQGATGLQGVTGLPGIQGATGLIGATGTIGITGFALNGITGLRGFTGINARGETGLQGSTGVIGITGLIGATGISIQGATGLQGITGLTGTTGVAPTGVTGFLGATGILAGGATGIQGITGVAPLGISTQGTTGITQGITGIRGITGIAPPGVAAPYQNLSTTTQASGTSLSYTIPASTLTVNEQYLDFVTWGNGATQGLNAPTTITITFGSTTIMTATLAQDAAAGTYVIRGIILRTGASAEEIIVGQVNSGVTTNTITQRTSATENLSNDLSLQVSVTSNGSGQSVRALVVRKVLQA